MNSQYQPCLNIVRYGQRTTPVVETAHAIATNDTRPATSARRIRPVSAANTRVPRPLSQTV
ncbi:hypothetical protein F8B89_26525, partial [Escherichia coli]|uniref:hypothetical protein n=1 Tax=Escherichia coli TaxID=562 RepID=UPI002929996E